MFLNRLNITGEINSNTPKIVLNEIANTLSIRNEHNINRLILKINKSYNKNKIREDYENHIPSLRIVASYVNYLHKSWKRSDLIKAFNFLCSFENNNNFNNKDFTYGQQTPDNIENLNACVLYRLCKNNSIYTNLETTMEEMANNLKLYFSISSNENNIKTKIYDYLRFDCTFSDLINISNIIDLNSKIENKKHENILNLKNKYNYKDYEKCSEEILRNDDENINPKNEIEAIVMAALYFKIDIRICEDPLYEYKLLSTFPYFPHDKRIKEKIKESYIHPDSLQNPFIDKNFKPDFPPNMYSNRDLTYLCGQEGMFVYDDTHYSSLQMSHLTEIFIHGKQGNIINTENTFLEKIKELEYDNVIIYGIRNENKFIGFTYGELCDTFSNYKRFINPITNDLFSEELIDKLYLLTQKDKRKTESEEIYKERLELGEEIERIKIYISTKNKTVKQFIEKYEKLEKEDKEKVEKCLNALLNLGMYMRNWDGIGNYPLNVNSTNFSEDKQIVVDDRVTQGLIDFEKLVAENDLGIILNLPLMQYHKESNTFVTSNDPSEGLTIKDRINIVRGGENDNNMSSCIRMSSNKICATSYYYMVLIGFRIPFNISEVYEIT